MPSFPNRKIDVDLAANTLAWKQDIPINSKQKNMINFMNKLAEYAQEQIGELGKSHLREARSRKHTRVR